MAPRAAQLSLGGQRGKDGHLPEQAQLIGLQAAKGAEGRPLAVLQLCHQTAQPPRHLFFPAMGPPPVSLSEQGTRPNRSLSW